MGVTIPGGLQSCEDLALSYVSSGHGEVGWGALGILEGFSNLNGSMVCDSKSCRSTQLHRAGLQEELMPWWARQQSSQNIKGLVMAVGHFS